MFVTDNKIDAANKGAHSRQLQQIDNDKIQVCVSKVEMRANSHQHRTMIGTLKSA